MYNIMSINSIKAKKYKYSIILIFIGILYITIWNYSHMDISNSQIEGAEIDMNNKAVFKEVFKEKQESEIAFQSKFTIESLAEHTKDKISGVSWTKDAPVRLEDLRYLKVSYWDFDNNQRIGELIVNKNIAEEVVDIFEELYDAQFPIEKINLVDDYNADDDLSMADNNSSAFNFRPIMGTNRLSKHSYGLAVDINPVQNPFIINDEILPPNSLEYIDRNNIRNGMIVKGDACYNAFVSRGWAWGGEWKTMKDYQHFQK